MKFFVLKNLSLRMNSSNKPTLFVEHLDTIDCAVFDLLSGIVGRSWWVNLEIEGSVDKEGFIAEFGAIKKQAKKFLKFFIDHKLLVPQHSPHIAKDTSSNQERWIFSFPVFVKPWEYRCPQGAVLEIPTESIEEMFIEQEMEKHFSSSFLPSETKVRFRLEEEIFTENQAFYCYTHGLPKHRGYCQRLFHGHRSKIKIWKNTSIDRELEWYITKKTLRNSCHFASRSQVSENLDQLVLGSLGRTENMITLCYRGTMGEFFAKLPANHVFLLPNEATVEEIGYVIWKQLITDFPNKSAIQIACYEGIGKGVKYG